MNKLLHESCCFFPTRVLIVDDNENFAETVAMALGKHVSTHACTDAQKSLKTLQAQPASNWLSERCISQFDDHEFDTQSSDNYLKLDMNAIADLMQQDNRHDLFSVVIVDYSMPDLDGISFCQQINNPAIKKIMLTGEGDHQLAVNAFNQELIDRFIMKDAPDMFEQLLQAVHELQQAYFASISQSILHDINAKQNALQAHSRTELLSMHEIDDKLKEFYLLDARGSVLLRLENDSHVVIAVRHRDDFDDDHAIAKDNAADEDVINHLAHKQKILLIPSEDTPIAQWQDHLYSATQHHAMPDYYYAVIREPSAWLSR